MRCLLWGLNKPVLLFFHCLSIAMIKRRPSPRRTGIDYFLDEVNQTMELPGLNYFVGRRIGKKIAAQAARPHFERILQERDDAFDAADKIQDDSLTKYNTAIKDLYAETKRGWNEMIKTFLQALKYDATENTGLENGIFVRSKKTGLHIHMKPSQISLFQQDLNQYFPNYPGGTSDKDAGTALGKAFDKAKTYTEAMKEKKPLPDKPNEYENRFPHHKYPKMEYGTGELVGRFQDEPVLISHLKQFPAEAIAEDIEAKMGKNLTAPPQITYPSLSPPDAVDIDDVLEDMTNA